MIMGRPEVRKDDPKRTRKREGAKTRTGKGALWGTQEHRNAGPSILLASWLPPRVFVPLRVFALSRLRVLFGRFRCPPLRAFALASMVLAALPLGAGCRTGGSAAGQPVRAASSGGVRFPGYGRSGFQDLYPDGFAPDPFFPYHRHRHFPRRPRESRRGRPAFPPLSRLFRLCRGRPARFFFLQFLSLDARHEQGLP